MIALHVILIASCVPGDGWCHHGLGDLSTALGTPAIASLSLPCNNPASRHGNDARWCSKAAGGGGGDSKAAES